MKCVLCGVLTKSFEIANFAYYFFFVHYDALTSNNSFRETQGLSPTRGQNKCMEGCFTDVWADGLRLLESFFCFNFVFNHNLNMLLLSTPVRQEQSTQMLCPKVFSPTPLLMQDNSLTCSSSIFYNTQFNFPFRFPKLFSVGCL